MTQQTIAELESVNRMARSGKRSRLALYVAMINRRTDWGPEYERGLIMESALSALARMHGNCEHLELRHQDVLSSLPS